MIRQKNEFIPPPEAPIFEPSWEEFCDPLAYIDQIRPVGEKYGIVKIKPPPSWQPPFAVDVENFKFTPRIQKLNELEALSRVKLNFIDQLTKFWRLQGISLKLPMLDGKFVDLYTLQKIVMREGGFLEACRKDAWIRISLAMGYSQGRGCEMFLSHHYEKIVHPYDLFLSGASLNAKKLKNVLTTLSNEADHGEGVIKIEHQNFFIPTKTGKLKKMRRMASNQPCYQREELQSLRVQMSSSPTKITIKSPETGDESEDVKQEPLFISKADQYFCEVCDGGDDDSLMLLCDGCDNAYHTYCLVPPLEKVPPGDWMCPKCIAKECCRPMEAYGFEQSRVEYSLETFGAMADQFKANHFGVSPHMVSYSACEKEFWRLVECLEEDVSVEYGADVHSGEQGSGFPTEKTKEQFLGYEEYITSGWNLNNLPILDLSVLRHVSGDISGMMIPWCYVGMCFSSFSWHIEDHWSYSVNYMHWGEPKTWYGVPGFHAQLLEECMMKEVPELFRDSPDLLHQLTTIINPNVLMDYGVQVYRTDQCPGEFVITFPRSYHAGFNQGYNFAEAVNFCPPDWVKLGRECIEDYRRLKRQCVFSHDQLLCEMADKSRTLNLKMAAVVHDDLLEVVAKEAKLRECAINMGFKTMERFYFETQDDDDRQCDACRTTCYLSGIICPLCPERLICLQHDLLSEFKCGCHPSSHILRFRHTTEELHTLVEALRVRSLSLDVWKTKVSEILQSRSHEKPDISYLKELIDAVTEENLPKDDLLQRLKDTVASAESCVESARELMNKKVHSRQQKVLEVFLYAHSMTILQQHQQQQHAPHECVYGSRVAIAELKLFCDRVNDLPCSFKEADLIKDLLEKVIVLQKEVTTILLSDNMPSTGRLQELVDWSANLDVEFPELIRLHQLLVQSKWLSEYNAIFNHHSEHTVLEMKLDIKTLRKLCGGLLANVQASLHPLYLSASARVKSLLSSSEMAEKKAEHCLKERPTIGTIEMLIEEANALNCVDLPNVSKVRDLMAKAKQWQELASMQMGRGHGLHLDELDYLIELGALIPVRFESLDSFQNRLKLAVQWKQKVFFTFFHGSKKSILQPWFDEVGIILESNYPRKKDVVFSKDGTFSCPNSPITLASLQTTVKATVEKLINSRNTDTKKLLENGKATSNSSTCDCGRSFTDHVRCCVLCTIIYQVDCSLLQDNVASLQQPSSNQACNFPSKSLQAFGEATKTNSTTNVMPFGSGFSSSLPIMGFPTANQGLFSSPGLSGNSFPSANVLSGTHKIIQFSSFSLFGTSNDGTSNMFSPTMNRLSSVGSLIVNNQSQQMFSPNTGNTNLFQWTTNQSLPAMQKTLTALGTIGNASDSFSTGISKDSSFARAHLCSYCKDCIDRPSYEELKALVAGWYTMSGVCMPEGRALIYLDNLVNEWQQKARKLIASRELVVASGLLDLPSIEGKDDLLTSELPIPESIFRLSSDAILRPRLMTLDVSVALQTQMSDLLVEMLALNIETKECRLIRSLLYACYEKIVLTEAMKKEEEARQQAKLEEDKQKKLEEAERQKKAAEEKRKKEEEEAKKRKLEEEEYRRRMEEEDKRRKLVEEEQQKRKEKHQSILQQTERESMEKKRKFNQLMSSEEHSVERALKMRSDQSRKKFDIISLDDGKKSSNKNVHDSYASDVSDTGDVDDEDDNVLSQKIGSITKLPNKKTSTVRLDGSARHISKPNLSTKSNALQSSNLSILKNFLSNDNSEDSMDDQSSFQAWKSLGSGKQKPCNLTGKKTEDWKNKSNVKSKVILSENIYTDDDDNDDADILKETKTLKGKKSAKDENRLSSLKKPKKVQGGKKHKRRKKKKDDDDSGDGEDGDDSNDDDGLFGNEGVAKTGDDLNTWEVCSSKSCQKPIGAKLDWVQCDHCEQWYHLVCVGLLELPDEDEEYTCPSCSNKRDNSRPKNDSNFKSRSSIVNRNRKHKKIENKHKMGGASGQQAKQPAVDNKSKSSHNYNDNKMSILVSSKHEHVKNKMNSFSCAISDASPAFLKKKKKPVESSGAQACQIGIQGNSLGASPGKNNGKHQVSHKSYVIDSSDDNSDEANSEVGGCDEYYGTKNRATKRDVALKHGTTGKDIKHSNDALPKKKQKTLSSSSSSSLSLLPQSQLSSLNQGRPQSSPRKHCRGTSKSKSREYEDDDDEEEEEEDDSVDIDNQDDVNDGPERNSDDSESSGSQRQQNSNFDSYLYTPWLNKS